MWSCQSPGTTSDTLSKVRAQCSTLLTLEFSVSSYCFMTHLLEPTRLQECLVGVF